MGPPSGTPGLNYGFMCSRTFSGVQDDLPELEQLFHRQPNVFGYLLEQDWRNIPTFVKRDSRSTSVLVPILPVRAPLTYLLEAESFQYEHDLVRFKNGVLTHFKVGLPFACL